MAHRLWLRWFVHAEWMLSVCGRRVIGGRIRCRPTGNVINSHLGSWRRRSTDKVSRCWMWSNVLLDRKPLNSIFENHSQQKKVEAAEWHSEKYAFSMGWKCPKFIVQFWKQLILDWGNGALHTTAWNCSASSRINRSKGLKWRLNNRLAFQMTRYLRTWTLAVCNYLNFPPYSF